MNQFAIFTIKLLELEQQVFKTIFYFQLFFEINFILQLSHEKYYFLAPSYIIIKKYKQSIYIYLFFCFEKKKCNQWL